jgi:alcohol dehydrogenase class IV
VTREQVFTLEATPLKYGPGAAAEAGWELERLGVKRAMLVSDPGVAEAGITGRVRILQVLSDTHHVATQGPVWRIGGRAV